MRQITVILLCCIYALSTQAQSEEEEKSSHLFSLIFQEYESAYSSDFFFPKFSIGTGILSFHGDANNNYSRDFTNGLPGFHIELEQELSPYYSLGFRYMRGKVYGDKTITNTNIIFNFQSQISAYSTFVQYNFGKNKHLYPYHMRSLSPFVRIGLEVLQTPEPWGDLYSNNDYLYKWTDGSFRNIPQDPTTAYQSEILFRDYVYESSYIRENIDNVSNYSPLVLSVPIEFGANFILSPQCNLNVGYQYHIAFSNKLDNISTAGDNYTENSERKGTAIPDGISYAYVSLTININNRKQDIYNDTSSVNKYNNYWDADNDGVPEIIDECPFTPENVETTANGCPVDSDNDAVGNYIDVENKTNQFYNDKAGKGFSKQDIINKMLAGETISHEQIYQYYPDLLNGGTVFRQFYKKIPHKFRAIDSDRNLYIDIEELLHAIDTFFDEGENAGIGSHLTVEDLFELIEFFFLQ
jgi:hypothetical protein